MIRQGWNLLARRATQECLCDTKHGKAEFESVECDGINMNVSCHKKRKLANHFSVAVLPD